MNSLQDKAIISYYQFNECDNDLWFHDINSIVPPSNSIVKRATIHKLSNAAKYELWHQSLGHPGSKTMESIHQHANGVPQLKGNPFYRCPACMSGKLCIKRPIGKSTAKDKLGATKTIKQSTNNKSTTDELYLPTATPGQHFHMDFGFVRGSD